MSITTRGGDDGTTGLPGGSRVPKDHPRCAACGALDELQAILGVARAFLEDKENLETLLGIQKDLLNLCARVADPQGKTDFEDARIEPLDRGITQLEAKLPPLKSFILRGGPPGAAHLHLACTVCRRAERRVVAVSRETELPPAVLKYLNRLSDLLFLLARDAG